VVRDEAAIKDEAAAAKAAGDPLAEVERLNRELAAAQLKAAAGGGKTVRLRVGGPHSSMSYGGVTITSEFSDVPVHHQAALSQAAADAGVELIQEG
jgi:hypothetical protein